VFADIRGKACGRHGWELAQTGLRAEIDIKIFQLAGPAAAKRGLDAAARGPAAATFAEIGGEASGGIGEGRRDTAIGEATSDVAQHRSRGETDAAARGAEPVETLAELEARANDAEHAVSAIRHASALYICFNTEDQAGHSDPGGLPVVADLAAGEAAERHWPHHFKQGAGHRYAGAVTPEAEACVRTEIESGPVVDCGSRRSLDRQIRSLCGGANGGQRGRSADFRRAYFLHAGFRPDSGRLTPMIPFNAIASCQLGRARVSPHQRSSEGTSKAATSRINVCRVRLCGNSARSSVLAPTKTGSNSPRISQRARVGDPRPLAVEFSGGGEFSAASDRYYRRCA
jgi:hypothetical protein